MNRFPFNCLKFLTPLILLSGCSDTSTTVYFPTNKGMTWTYNVEQLTLTEPVFYRMIITNFGKQHIDNKDTYVRKLHNNTYQYFDQDETGLYQLLKDEENNLQSKKYVFQFPLETNTTWQADGDPFLMRRSIDEINAQQNSMPGLSQDSDLKMQYTIESLNESVTVPAGKFKSCMKVVGRGQCSFSSTGSFARKMVVEITNNEWYCPEIGLTKVERRETSERVSLKPVHYVIELEKISSK